MATRTAKSNKKVKTCFIVRRYFIKLTGSVCCVVRNERGNEYTTCLHADGRTSCSCEGHETWGKTCYHEKHVIAAEAKRVARPVVVEIAPVAEECPTHSRQDAKISPVAESVMEEPQSYAEALKNASVDEKRAIWKRIQKDERIRNKEAAAQYWEKVRELRTA